MKTCPRAQRHAPAGARLAAVLLLLLAAAAPALGSLGRSNQQHRVHMDKLKIRLNTKAAPARNYNVQGILKFYTKEHLEHSMPFYAHSKVLLALQAMQEGDTSLAEVGSDLQSGASRSNAAARQRSTTDGVADDGANENSGEQLIDFSQIDTSSADSGASPAALPEAQSSPSSLSSFALGTDPGNAARAINNRLHLASLVQVQQQDGAGQPIQVDAGVEGRARESPPYPSQLVESDLSVSANLQSRRVGHFQQRATRGQFIGGLVGGLVKGVGNVVNGLFGSIFNPERPEYWEDCAACRYVWYQVEQDVGPGRNVEDVQASFEHNCIDAQKTDIFYAACEDMFDDIYAMVDDYMEAKKTTSEMCQAAKLCA